MSETLLEKKYNSVQVEDKWYKHWLEKKYFQAEVLVFQHIPLRYITNLNINNNDDEKYDDDDLPF